MSSNDDNGKQPTCKRKRTTQNSSYPLVSFVEKGSSFKYRSSWYNFGAQGIFNTKEFRPTIQVIQIVRSINNTSFYVPLSFIQCSPMLTKVLELMGDQGGYDMFTKGTWKETNSAGYKNINFSSVSQIIKSKECRAFMQFFLYGDYAENLDMEAATWLHTLIHNKEIVHEVREKMGLGIDDVYFLSWCEKVMGISIHIDRFQGLYCILGKAWNGLFRGPSWFSETPGILECKKFVLICNEDFRSFHPTGGNVTLDKLYSNRNSNSAEQSNPTLALPAEASKKQTDTSPPPGKVPIPRLQPRKKLRYTETNEPRLSQTLNKNPDETEFSKSTITEQSDVFQWNTFNKGDNIQDVISTKMNIPPQNSLFSEFDEDSTFSETELESLFDGVLNNFDFMYSPTLNELFNDEDTHLD